MIADKPSISAFAPLCKKGKVMGQIRRYTESIKRKGECLMIYACQTKCCHFLFLASDRAQTCPDCGHKRIRPATRSERAEFFRLCAEKEDIRKTS